MAGRAVRGLPWAAVPLALLSYGLYLALGLSSPPVNGPADFTPDDAVWVLSQVLFAIVGAVIASRRPESPIGWLFCIAGLLGVVEGIAARAAVHALAAGPWSPARWCGRLAVRGLVVPQHCLAGAGRPAVSLRSAAIAWLVGGGVVAGSRWSGGRGCHGAAVAGQRARAAGQHSTEALVPRCGTAVMNAAALILTAAGCRHRRGPPGAAQALSGRRASAGQVADLRRRSGGLRPGAPARRGPRVGLTIRLARPGRNRSHGRCGCLASR